MLTAKSKAGGAVLDSSKWNTRLRIGIILAVPSRARRGEGVANWIRALLGTRPGVEGELLDLQIYRLPPCGWTEISSAVGERRIMDELVRQWSEKIAGLDGFIIVIPEYNRVYPGQLKNAIDRATESWAYKPVAFVNYEGIPFGRPVVEQLRNMTVDRRMVLIRADVNTRLVVKQARATGRSADVEFAMTANSMIDELLWWAQVTKSGRASVAPPATQAENG